MKPEELLAMLKDTGLDDEAIKALLSETIAMLEPKPEEDMGGADGVAAPEESDAEKADRIFGAI